MLATTVKKVLELHKKEGIEQGIELGLEQGIEQGIRQKAIEDAGKLKASGVAIKTIATCVGLSEEEVERL